MKLAGVLFVSVAAVAAGFLSFLALWSLPEPSRTYALLALVCLVAGGVVMRLVDE